MLKSLELIAACRAGAAEGDAAPWLRILTSAEEKVVNLERVQSLRELQEANPVLDYVERSLQLLEETDESYWLKELVEEVLVWSETAKGGSLRERAAWQAEGVNLSVHNLGSAELYRRQAGPDTAGRSIVRLLIETHGLIGQQIRGEVPAAVNRPLHRLVREGHLQAGELERVLLLLNRCVIGAVSPGLWDEVREEAAGLIRSIAYSGGPEEVAMEQRLRRLRAGSIAHGEDFSGEWAGLAEREAILRHLAPLEQAVFWYVESALQSFSLEPFLKVMALTAPSAAEAPVAHVSFEEVMKAIYYDYKGVKRINVYKQRIIEKYLAELSWEQILSGEPPEGASPHLTHAVFRKPGLPDTAFFDFRFSPAADKLIEFCMEAEKSALYERAVLMLFDLFGLRRDAFDRFHNEETYLDQMNGTADYKAVILEYVTGRKVLDIGPGGGVLLDLIEERMPGTVPVGIDISSNVVEALRQRKRREGRRWEVIQGDALDLKSFVEAGTVDTVIFSSILHELYSYVPTGGHKFNRETVAAALRSAFDVLAPGGAIIIRDGIMTEPAELKRRIKFLEPEGMAWLERYAADFAGRTIRYTRLSDREAELPVNDAMEFLYTYTWGEEAYVHEVQEQFGYFTPSEYRRLIGEWLGGSADIEVFRHYLQAGYTEALGGRIEFTDEQGNPVPLPDSTCFIVIRKRV